MREITARQAEVLSAIINHIEQVGAPPTIRELGRTCAISSLRGVTVHLDALKSKGFIDNSPSRTRGIKVLRNPMGMPVNLRLVFESQVKTVRIGVVEFAQIGPDTWFNAEHGSKTYNQLKQLGLKEDQ